MADKQHIEKSYTEEGRDTGSFFVRTMKKDIERLRQGLPIHENTVTGKVLPPQRYDTPQKLATTVQAHSPVEQPPKESATTIPGVEAARPQINPAPQEEVRAASRQIPPISQRPFPLQAPPWQERPIETIQPQARPAQPQVPRTGKMEIEKTQAIEPALTLFQRIFPTRKRLAVVLCVTLALLTLGIYALFAYFGKPLPGTRFVFSDPTPTPFSVKTPSPSPTTPEVVITPTSISTPTPSPSPGPLARTPHLPISRLALVDLPESATKLDLAEQLTGFANISQNPGDFTQVIVRHESTETPFGASELFQFFGISAPEGFFGELSQDITLFFYAPRETGTLSIGHSAPAHFGILIPVRGSVNIFEEKLKTWEATLGGDIAPFAFGREWMLGQNPLFESNLYQGTLIRYQNFPDPYIAADYAVFEGSDPPLFIFTTSRESIFSVIGALNYRNE
ncbi:MAG: hypothetical protein Q7S09_04145 [bacterium]|nr:hypothetical protein [bacterium]